MKFMKRIAAPLIALAFAVALLVAPNAAFATSGTYVFDEYGIFSSDEFSGLEAQAEDLADSYGMGVYLLITDYMDGLANPTSSQRTSYATSYYREHGLGLNKDGNSIGDGIMLVIAVDSRDYVTIAYGQGSYSFSDEGIDAMETSVTSHLSGNDWYGGSKAYYDEIGSQLGYYARHGSAQEPLDMFDYIIRILIVLGIPAMVAWSLVKRGKAEMLTAVRQTEAGQYLDPSSFRLTASNDQFVNTTLAVQPRPKDNDSGGGGGGWGGGGGGGFSSSGGGKF